MSARNDETWLFVVEWFDPMPRLKRMYLLKYFVQQHQVEMVDIKNKKMFLKKTPLTVENTKEDFCVGKKILVLSRELDIIDYGDLATKQALQHQNQQACIILSSNIYQKWGQIIQILNENLTVIGIKSIYTNKDTANEILQITNSNKSSDILTRGVSLAISLSGSDAINTVFDCTSQKHGFDPESVIIGDNGMQVNELTDLIFDGKGGMKDTATLDNCTCCIIKPHVIKSRNIGDIIDMIIKQGYEISCISTVTFEKTQAEEFLEVYNGVVPDYSDQVIQLSSGMCVALEVRAEDAVMVFRETAGPWDVGMAKELRPESIRGIFGESNVRSAVYCTDMTSDGATDCEYAFKIMK
mmetsp:Transcript_28170/g.27014  ORF Transcript_28170/g.27014 Transcript_28170/m.27014 type:complete len:354 (+) Transcript_28170:119-1180(+)